MQHTSYSGRLAALAAGLLTATLLSFSHSAVAADEPMKVSAADTAIVFTDPQIEVLDERGGAWPLVKDSIKENGTIDNMDKLFKAAKKGGYQVFISPHYYYPTDDDWHFRDSLSQMMHDNHMFARKSITDTTGLAGSTAAWLPRFKPYIAVGKTVVVAPHKLYGPQTNDLVLQLRKRDIKRVILGGMLANMCVESHARDLIEQGFEVIIVRDAVAAPRHPQWGDGYQAALINYRYMAKHVPSTDEVVKAMASAR